MPVNRRVFIAALAAAAPAVASGQDHKKIVVGFLSWWPSGMEGIYVPHLRKGLAKYGYVEGQNLELLVSFTGGDVARTREAAQRYVDRAVDVIVATATPAVTIVKEATRARKIPVVMAPVADPIATGLVESIARPGGNLTGMSMAGPDLSAKRIQFVREAMPGLQAAAFVGSTRDPNTRTFVASIERAASEAGVKLAVKLVDTAAEIDDALMERLKQAGAQALVVQPIFIGRHAAIIATARRAGLPVVSDFPAFAEGGALLTYGINDLALLERAGYFVDRIVKGARPADLPIELPTEFALVINMKTAAAFGLTVPRSLLVQATEVID